MDINQLGTSNLTTSGLLTPDVLATSNNLFISQPNTQNSATPASLSFSQSALFGSPNLSQSALFGSPNLSQSASLNSAESIVYLNSLGISPTNPAVSTSTVSLVDQNNFSIGNMPKTLTFKGSSASEDLYLKLDASSILNFSTDGTNYFSLNLADLSTKLDISVDLGDGNDSLYIDSSVFKALQNTDSKISFDGGLGNNTLYGPAIDTTWNVTGQNSGNLGKIEFQNVSNLKGAADNQDEFVFSSLGSLSGVADGGAGGFDTLVLDGGSYASANYMATSPNDGTIALDDKLIKYAGLEPIIDNTVVTDRVFNATNSDDNIVVQADSTIGRTIIFSSNATFESISFLNPSSSLTINALDGKDTFTINSLGIGFNANLNINGGIGNDSVVFGQNLSLNGRNLSVNAESITVASGVILDLTKVGGTSGDISFIASDTQTQNLLSATGLSQITLSGATIKAGNVNLSATSTVSGSINNIAALVNLASTAGVALVDSRIESSGNVLISSISSVTGDAVAQGLNSQVDTSVDAAVAISIINSSAIADVS